MSDVVKLSAFINNRVVTSYEIDISELECVLGVILVVKRNVVPQQQLILLNIFDYLRGSCQFRLSLSHFNH